MELKIRTRTLQIVFLLLPLLVCLTLAVGLRTENTGSDTKNYLFFYDMISSNYLFLWPLEYGFQGVLYLCALLAAPPYVYLSTIALLNFVLILFLNSELSKFLNERINPYRLLFLLGTFFFVSPFFFAVMANVIRHGTAVFALFIFYIVLIQRTRLYLLIPLALIALGFHKTALITVLFSPLILLPYTMVFQGTILASFCYLSGLTIKLISLFSTYTGFDLYSKITDYAAVSLHGLHYMGGRRYDFALFTMALGVIFHVLPKYFLVAGDRSIFRELVKVYWILVLPFFFFGFGAFSDRYLLAGWLYVSILAAVFLGLLIRKFSVRIGWNFLIFLCSLLYFIFKVQSFVNF